MAQLQSIFTKNKKGNTRLLLSVPCWVAPGGEKVEPVYKTFENIRRRLNK